MEKSRRPKPREREAALRGATHAHGHGAELAWDWDGGEILSDCIVPACRPSAAGGTYETDIRAFLQVGHNAVVARCIEQKILSSLDGPRKDGKRARRRAASPIRQRTQGSFDLRAAAVLTYVSNHVGYAHRTGRDAGSDPWQFPDETLARGEGDCEDRAFLIAALLSASGISEFNVRVALGQVVVDRGTGPSGRLGHAWVMYKTEAGHWTVLEPTLPPRPLRIARRSPIAARRAVRYVPFFLFNGRHLWGVRETRAEFEKLIERDCSTRRPPRRGLPRGSTSGSTLGAWRDFRRGWARMKPTFAGEIHYGLLDDALHDVAHPTVLAALRMGFRNVFGHIVDDVDYRMGDYDPRDHFDSGYILKGWQWVEWRLREFGLDPFHRTQHFAYAAHAIADFYSHTSYPHFADAGPAPDSIALYDPSRPLGGLTTVPVYDASRGFDISGFTAHRNWNPAWSRTEAWNGKIVSGRYAMNRDTWPGFFNMLTEGRTYIPDELIDAPDFLARMALPHHNEIAVDSPSRESTHTLYPPAAYDRQYRARRDAARRHIREAYVDSGGPPPQAVP